MRCIDKVGGKHILFSFLMENGFSEDSIRMMFSRKRISAKAIFCIVTHFKEIDFKQSDFYDKEER